MSLKVSIIIPVHNEESVLRRTLESISNLDIKPYEVIVVDNNSTDGSVKVAKEFPFVKIINEPKQGLIFARNNGFNSATGDILGRIDADAILDRQWTAELLKSFSSDSVAGVAGVNKATTFPKTDRFSTRLWPVMYLWNTSAFFRVPILLGSNMAISVAAWRKIKDQACLDDKVVHEDQDISCLLAESGQKVVTNYRLIASCSEQDKNELTKLVEYLRRRNTTREFHEERLGRLTTNRIGLVETLIKRGITFLPEAIFLAASVIFSLPKFFGLIKRK